MQAQQRKLSESQMNKWRTLVALAHVDGNICANERSFIQTTLSNRNIDPEQIKTIMSDFETPHKPCEFFEKITEPRDRGLLFYSARLMFVKEGELCDYVKMYYDKFKAEHMGGLNMDAIMIEVDAIRAETKEPTKSGSWAFQQFKSVVNKYF